MARDCPSLFILVLGYHDDDAGPVPVVVRRVQVTLLWFLDGPHGPTVNKQSILVEPHQY